MASTQEQEDTLIAAIARGELSVRFADGRQVTYRSTSELMQALAMIRQERSIPMNRTTATSFARD